MCDSDVLVGFPNRAVPTSRVTLTVGMFSGWFFTAIDCYNPYIQVIFCSRGVYFFAKRHMCKCSFVYSFQNWSGKERDYFFLWNCSWYVNVSTLNFLQVLYYLQMFCRYCFYLHILIYENIKNHVKFWWICGKYGCWTLVGVDYLLWSSLNSIDYTGNMQKMSIQHVFVVISYSIQYN